MWNKIKNLFGKKSELKNDHHVIEVLIEVQKEECIQEGTCDFNETSLLPNSNDESQQPVRIGLALADAISMLIYEHGRDFFASGNAYNALSDYGAFHNKRAGRNIFKSLEAEGLFNELLQLTLNDNIDNKVLRITQTLVSNFGYDSEIINSMLCEIMFGLGLLSESECRLRLQNNTKSDDSDLLSGEQIQSPPSTPEQSIPPEPYNPSHVYKFPSIDVLPINNQSMDFDSVIEDGKKRIEWVLATQGITAKSITGYPGPRVSMYEIDVDPRKLSKIIRMEKEIISALSPIGGRILNPIPGKMAIGIELPNNVEYALCIRDLFDNPDFSDSDFELPIVFGFDSMGNVVIRDLAKLPHLLICGEMQQGKTSLVRQFVASLLLKKTIENVKFTFIDTCGLDLLGFKRMCGYWMAQREDDGDYSVIYGTNDGMKIIHDYIIEIECRKVLFDKAKVSNIKEYNEKFCNRILNPNKGHHYMPYLVLICNEIAPFVSSNGKEFESMVSSLISRASNTGIHCVFTTKDTSTEILTPSIRANFPVRASLRIHLPNESKLVTGSNAATNLLANGDSILVENGLLSRFQSAKCDPEDVQPLIDECYKFCQLDLPYFLPESLIDLTPPAPAPFDTLLEEAARFLVSCGTTASTSTLQRRYSIGYNRAGKIMDQLESIGVVGSATGAKPRSVLVDTYTLESILASLI